MSPDPISAAELEELRDLAEDLAMPSTCTVLTLTTASDGRGGRTEDWTPSAPTPCRISAIGGGEGGVAGDRINQESTHAAYLPVETPITESSRIVHEGTTYAVTLVIHRSNWEVQRKVEMVEVTD